MLGLSFHRGYACRDSGACCSSGWTIPIERPILARLLAASASGRLMPRAAHANALLEFPEPGEEYGGLLGTDDAGRCWFHQPDRDGRSGCTVQQVLGHDALPHACQQFPRVAVLRPGSVAVSLSHYCPTAAGLLLRDAEARLENVSTCGSGRRPLEGLDMRSALPPLLRPDVLFTWDGFDRWERFVLEALADSSQSLDATLTSIAVAAERMRQWVPARGCFDDFVARTLARAPTARLPDDPPDAAEPDESRYDAVRAAVPDGLASANPAGPVRRSALDGRDQVVRRYLMARTWASWVAHEGSGIRGYVRWILTVRAVLQVEAGRHANLLDAVRAADLLLVHLASPRALVRQLSRREHAPLWHGAGDTVTTERKGLSRASAGARVPSSARASEDGSAER
jgi:hypothetical protein